MLIYWSLLSCISLMIVYCDRIEASIDRLSSICLSRQTGLLASPRVIYCLLKINLFILDLYIFLFYYIYIYNLSKMYWLYSYILCISTTILCIYCTHCLFTNIQFLLLTYIQFVSSCMDITIFIYDTDLLIMHLFKLRSCYERKNNSTSEARHLE